MGDRFSAKGLAAVFLSPVSQAQDDVNYDTQGLHAATRFAHLWATQIKIKNIPCVRRVKRKQIFLELFGREIGIAIVSRNDRQFPTRWQ